MIYNVCNKELKVGKIDVLGVSSSSLLLIGDVQTIQLAATFDTPPESLIVGPFVPLTSQG